MATMDKPIDDAAGGMRNNTSPVPNIFPPPESMRPTLVGEHYSVVAGHPLVAMIAADVLERGGTAIDAGVAAGLASNVIQADMCNLGGVAPILVRQAGSDQVWSISGVGTWSESVTLQAYLERHKGDMPLGAPCSIVPAAADAWLSALSRFGTWSFADVAAPAIRYAREGFVLDRRTALAYELMGATFRNWDSSRAIYWPQGRAPREGDRLKQTDLALLLERLAAAEQGANREQALEAVRKAFYEGEVAERIVAWVNGNGGWMTLEDLAGFRNEVAPAKSYDYRGWRMFTGGTYSQAPVILQALSVLAGFDAAALAGREDGYLHLLTEAMKLAFSDREKFYCDPNFAATTIEELLSDEHVARLRALVNASKALPDLPTLDLPAPPATSPGKRRDTTNFTVVDAKGNAFSCSASDTIDGNPIVPGLGIMVSPRGVQSRLDAAHPAPLGPGRRPRLTPSARPTAGSWRCRRAAVTSFRKAYCRRSSTSSIATCRRSRRWRRHASPALPSRTRSSRISTMSGGSASNPASARTRAPSWRREATGSIPGRTMSSTPAASPYPSTWRRLRPTGACWVRAPIPGAAITPSAGSRAANCP